MLVSSGGCGPRRLQRCSSSGRLYLCLLQKHFQHKDYYVDLVHVMQDASFKTAYTYDLYSTIVKYKTSYYSTYLPNALTMVMAGIKDLMIFTQVKGVSMLMGEFLQIQDDFIDCFGDELDIKKIGTDSADGKCSWVMVTALERANTQQRKIILENYGKNDKDQIKRVKEVYHEIVIPDLYARFLKVNRERTKALIQKFDPAFPKQLFYFTIKRLDEQYKITC